MSEDNTPSDVGLFLIHPTPTIAQAKNPLYARVSSITVYSAPKPTRSRVVGYQVTFWETFDGDVPMQSEGHLWTRELGEATFYFPISPNAIVKESLVYSCISNFLSKIAPKLDKKPIRPLIDQLYSRQVDGYGWDLYVTEKTDPHATISFLKHIEEYRCDETGLLVFSANKILYNLVDEEETMIESPFEDWENTFNVSLSEGFSFSRRIAKHLFP